MVQIISSEGGDCVAGYPLGMRQVQCGMQRHVLNAELSILK